MGSCNKNKVEKTEKPTFCVFTNKEIVFLSSFTLIALREPQNMLLEDHTQHKLPA